MNHGKPAPDVFLLAAEKMSIHPSCCLAIEDSSPGTLAGVLAGMTVFGCSEFYAFIASRHSALAKYGCLINHRRSTCARQNLFKLLAVTPKVK